MIPCDPNREVIDPRKLVEQHGREALAELVARESGYIFQLRPLKDLCLCLKSGMPLLAEGERGGGKTATIVYYPSSLLVDLPGRCEAFCSGRFKRTFLPLFDVDTLDQQPKGQRQFSRNRR